jgi:hypothetical protein
MQVFVIPGRLGSVKDAWSRKRSIPADIETVTVRRLGTETRVKALLNQLVSWPIQRFIERKRSS